jgi:S-adenosylmethionine:tRNA ribosyltransferase-isomerase
LIERKEDAFIVEFSWNDKSKNFLDILDIFGKTPLPPYIKRIAEEIDKKTYQTVFAKQLGSVAAPYCWIALYRRSSKRDKTKRYKFSYTHPSCRCWYL